METKTFLQKRTHSHDHGSKKSTPTPQRSHYTVHAMSYIVYCGFVQADSSNRVVLFTETGGNPDGIELVQIDIPVLSTSPDLIK